MSIITTLKNQKEVGNDIRNRRDNYDNSKLESRNLKFAKERWLKLEELWNVFCKNHEILCDSTEIDGSHEYFSDNYFNKTEKIYQDFSIELQKIIDRFEMTDSSADASVPQTKEPEKVYKAHTDDQQKTETENPKNLGNLIDLNQIFKNFSGSKTNLHNLSGSPNDVLENKYHNFQDEIRFFEALLNSYNQLSPADPQVRLFRYQEVLANKWAVIEKMHQRFMVEHYDYDATTFRRMEADFNLIHYDYKERVRNQHLQQQGSSGQQPRHELVAKLPKLHVPKFDNECVNYQSFKELFMTMVGSRPTLTEVEKFAYLKGQLEGESLRIIANLPIQHSSYNAAWDTLDARFENLHKITTKLFESIIDIKPMRNTNPRELKEMVDAISQTVTALANMGMPIDVMSNSFLYFHTERKIHTTIVRLYENTLLVPGTPRTYDHFMKFLQCRVQNSSSGGSHEFKESKPKTSFQDLLKKEKSTTVLISSTARANSSKQAAPQSKLNKFKKPIKCCCNENHLLYQCPKFVELKVDQRIKYCQETKRCLNCFNTSHKTKECRGRSCMKCSKKHNTLLHLEQIPEKTSLFGSAVLNEQFNHVFLATALIEVLDKYGNPIVIRALLDSGSQINMVTEKLHKKLGLSHNSTKMKINGVGNASVYSHKRLVIQVMSKHSGFKAHLEAYVVKHVTTCQPLTEVNTSGWRIPRNIALADPKFNIPATVDLIIGGELFYKLMSIGLISIGKNLPDIQNTVFGWVVIGKLLGLENHEVFAGISTQQSIDQQLAEFWKIEEKYQPASKRTQLEQDCEDYFERTTTRNPTNGRFIVKLQFLKEPSVLGKSESMAIRRFQFLEKRFDRDPSMKLEYVAFMREYENLGHMMPVSRETLCDGLYVIPHHAVRNPGSSTTKFRVVFDASAKTSTNISLNEILANGPILQDDLFSIMVRFRKHKYVFSADITKMYRKVEVDQNDQKWQVIVWREESHLPLQYYKLKTLTYGTTCASYLAIKSLQYLADEWKTEYPYGSIAAKRDFNVDDVMTGSDDLLNAILTQNQLIELCHKADFNLHKWCANHPALLDAIPKSKQEISLDFNAEQLETKALGIKWIPKTDQFKLHYEPKEYKKITKRTVLSETAQLFDPLGLVNPVIVLAKIFLQELWALKLDWDASLPMELHSKWVEFRKELLKLNDVILPRHMVCEDPVDIQLHAFADASTRAYGTACYLRSVSSSGKIQVTLICSKSRVAPVTATTLPRLELSAGMIMTELADKLNKTLEIKLSSLTYWTDSELVLSWIYVDKTYKTFVANRIASIRRKTKMTDWKYVNTKLNPADLISRGVLPEKLINSKLWWHGPEFLQKDKQYWPIIKPAFVKNTNEERTIKTVLSACPAEEHFIDRINHRNSIRVLQRVVAYVLRMKFRRIGKIPEPIQDQAFYVRLSIDELQTALTVIIKHCQQQSFSTEIDLIKKGAGEKTKFANFVPIIDADGVLRVGGRLQKANIPFEQRHPAILPKDNIITRLIMERVHLENMHAGPQALLAIVRQKYWPENGKTLAQSIVKQCVLCVRSKPKLMEQIMGNLPAERVNQARVFVNIGLDFGGPITIYHKRRGKQPTKAYICIFVCFTTKAIHIEAAANLTTEAFISCLKRFIARRGLPRKIFCDNATNFTSASNQLAELKQLMDNKTHQQQVINYCVDHQIEWKFIPPRSPHFGGLHEAGIKMAKLHLRKVLHSVNVTYDELITILAEIEAILNSRPLTPMSNDPTDLQPLTAGHFLIGAPMNSINDGKLQPTSKTRMWTKINMLKQEFWKRWSKEYLAELQHRNKWLNGRENIQIGSMVILKEINLPPLKWRMARVIKTISDDFGKIRVVIVRTDNGELKRAIHEIAVLPVEIDEELKVQEQQQEFAQPVVTIAKPKPSTSKDAQPVVTIAQPKPSTSKNAQPAYPKPSKSKISTKRSLNPMALAFEPRITRSRAKKNVSISTTMMLVLSFFMALVVGAIGQSCNVSSFETNPGLYFEEQGHISLSNDVWKIVCYIQLKDYWSQSITIKAILDRLDEICPKLASTEHCNITKRQLRTQLNMIFSKNELIIGFSHTRKRRALPVDNFNRLSRSIQYKNLTIKNFISFHESQKPLAREKRAWANFIGSGLSVVTGVLDDNDGKRYDEKIENLSQETRHLLQLIGNQTTMQEITTNIIKRDESGISRKLKQLENAIDDLRNNTAAQNEELFNTLALQAVSLIGNHFSTQNDLRNMITNTHHGKISTTIISPAQLRQHLQVIANNIPKHLMIPGDDQAENIAKIYATLTSKIRVTATRITIQLTIPLLHREFFKLYNIIPVPFVLRNSSLRLIDSSYKYIAVNEKQDHYYLFSHSQKSECKTYSDDLLICEQSHPMLNIQNGEALCEMAILTHPSKGIAPNCNLKNLQVKQLWSKLNSPNHFLFTMAARSTINIICNEKSSACSIGNSGIINLPSQCIIQSGNVEITSHNIFSNELPILLVPGMNITDVLQEKIHPYHHTTIDHHNIYNLDPELDLLSSAIQTQRFNENYKSTSTPINWHNIHHYAATYGIIVAVLIGAAYYLYTKKRNLCQRSTSPGSNSIELVSPISIQPIPARRQNISIIAPPANETVDSISFS